MIFVTDVLKSRICGENLLDFDFTTAGLLLSWSFHSFAAYHEWWGGRAPFLLIISQCMVSVAVGRYRL